MRARRIEGRTIAKVHQRRWPSSTGTIWVLDAIEFTDGTWLRFVVAEGGDDGVGDYGVEPVYPARGEQR